MNSSESFSVLIYGHADWGSWKELLGKQYVGQYHLRITCAAHMPPSGHSSFPNIRLTLAFAAVLKMTLVVTMPVHLHEEKFVRAGITSVAKVCWEQRLLFVGA